jgi:hypothetical protein
MSVSGMKYLTDVFMINANKNKPSTVSSASINAPLTSKANGHLTPLNLTPHNLPQHNLQPKHQETDRYKSKITSSIMYTQLPHQKMKENQNKEPHTHAQYFSQPNHPFIRTQPFSDHRLSAMDQPPNGFISYS